MRWFYYIDRSFNVGWLLVIFGVVVLCASGAADRGEKDGAELETCQAKFADAGFDKQQTSAVSDREVLEKCGSIPRYVVNEVWHINRRQSVDAPSKGAELIQCQKAFETSGLSADAALNATDAQLIQICETVPALLD